MLFGSRVSGKGRAAVGARFVVQSYRPTWRFPYNLVSHARCLAGGPSPFQPGDERILLAGIGLIPTLAG